MSFNLQTIVEKIALNSFKKITPSFPLKFSILPEELLTSMVYMGVEVTTYNGIYGDGVKTSAATCLPH